MENWAKMFEIFFISHKFCKCLTYWLIVLYLANIWRVRLNLTLTSLEIKFPKLSAISSNN